MSQVSEETKCDDRFLTTSSILYHTMLILIFRPFFIWRWHAELRQHPLALRAQIVCTEQAADVNELFRAYGRLFNFQYQSYLVSYCVYTAATIDVRLMRHDDKTIAEMAANRLVITLQMLETEAKQTPGIRRSIEIIRSHLNPQWFSESRGQSDRQPQSHTTALSQHQQRTPPPTLEEQSVPTPSIHSTVGESSDLPLFETMQAFINPELPIETSWLGWNLDDFGGGFVPDMAHWSSLGPSF
jgi:hypothetical protein